MALIIPLHGKKGSICDKALKMNDALGMLDIADKLVQSGAMKNEEYLRLAEKIKKDIFSF